MKEFPFDDPYWVSAADFVEAHLKSQESLLAPRRFVGRFENVRPYSAKLKSAEGFEWAIVHKGNSGKSNPELLESIISEFSPVFANEVFVVFSKRTNIPKLEAAQPHLASLHARLDLADSPSTPSKGKFFKLKVLNFEIDLAIKRLHQDQSAHDRSAIETTVSNAEPSVEPFDQTITANTDAVDVAIEAPANPEIIDDTASPKADLSKIVDPAGATEVETSIAVPDAVPDSPGLSESTDEPESEVHPTEVDLEPIESEPTEVDSGSEPVDYGTLSTAEIKELMDQRFSANEAYPMLCVWDQVRAEELNQQVINLTASMDDKRILEIGCGVGGSAPYITDCKEYIGTDLSEAAIAVASQAYGHRSNFKFMSMNAEELNFGDSEFDLFIAKEVIEHVPDAHACLQEAFRVLKPGGQIVLTSPNRDSLHLRMNRKLGYNDFKCSIDHVKEFTFQEALEMLQEHGFVIQETAGVFLTPYWGIPNVDVPVRHLTDNDPETVEIMRDLGSRVGGDYAFCFVISALKPQENARS
jgi:ubiquinone/menaquinone biosynthesis C-methylase UbiE